MTALFQPGSLVCAYLRDSGGESQELSTQQQLAAIVNYCQENGIILSEVFQDLARPGSTTVGRDGFQSMLDHFRHNAPEAGLIIWSFSRFARDFDDASFYRADLRRRGYILYSISDQVPDGHLGRLFEAVIDWKNAQFLEDLSRDVTRGLANLVGTYGAIPGTPPVGFARKPIEIGRRRDGSPHIGHKWEPDPEFASTIRLAFELRAAGVPLQDIHAQTHLYKSINSYLTFFSNPLYKGVLRYGNQDYPNYCTPIVDPATWQAAQRKQRQVHPRRQNSAYLLSGLAYCARCGAPLAGLTRAGHMSYACTRQRPHRQCDLQPIPAHVLDQAVLSTIVETVLSTENLAIQIQEYSQNRASKQAEMSKNAQLLQSKCKTVQRNIDNVTEAIAQMGSSPALMDKLRRLELEKASLQAELYNLERQIPPSTANLTDLSKQAETLKSYLESDLATAQRVLRGLVSRIVVDRNGREVVGSVTAFFTP